MLLSVKEMEVLCIFHVGSLSATIATLQCVAESGQPIAQMDNVKSLLVKLSHMTTGDAACLVFETLANSMGEMSLSPVTIETTLETAARYLVQKCAAETVSGTYLIHADDVPGDILPPGWFEAHIGTIVSMMQVYESVNEADVEDGVISVVMCPMYCPNYEPLPEEETGNQHTDTTATPGPLIETQFMTAYKNVSRIEDIFYEAIILFDNLPPAIQAVILNYHNEPATLQHCLRRGLQATKEIREDWHMVVAGIPTPQAEKGDV